MAYRHCTPPLALIVDEKRGTAGSPLEKAEERQRMLVNPFRLRAKDDVRDQILLESDHIELAHGS